MKKLLFVISNINIGGPQKSLVALLDEIDYSSFEVDLLILQPDGTLRKYINGNVNIIDTPELVSAFTLPSDNTSGALKTIASKCGVKTAACAMKEMVKGKTVYNNVSVARQHFWKKNSRHLKKIDKSYDAAFGILGLSTYFIVDCVDAARKYHWIRSDTRVLRRDENIDAEYFKRCSGFLSVSDECARIFEDIYPFAKGCVRTFYNYIPKKFYDSVEADTGRMKECGAGYKIITVCRLDPLKGLDMAIEACSILRERNRDVCWFVLGDGKCREEIEKMIRDRGIEDCFILLGFQYNTLAFINDADIVVHPSRAEGKSNAVDEALFCMKPTVVTDYPTAREVIKDGVNGIVCEMNGRSVAGAVEKLIDDPDLRNRLAASCRDEKSSENANEVLLQLC